MQASYGLPNQHSGIQSATHEKHPIQPIFDVNVSARLKILNAAA